MANGLMPAMVNETSGVRWSAAVGPWTVRPSISLSPWSARAVRVLVWRPMRAIVCSTTSRGSGSSASKQGRPPGPATRSTSRRSACAETTTPRMLGVPAAYFHGNRL